ncbi:MAG: MFS transporter [Proteobacteria bacterium]|jgi:MFS family permease|nr:MFS transporter [Pseudomonadota bacterium]MDA1136235.1 MFS transporter [Pseudomonadota bacterium]
MRVLSFNSSKSYSIPDLYLNIGHLLDHFMMLIFAKAAFDAGREFGLSYEEIIVYGTLGVIMFGAAAPLAGWLADKYSRAILITVYPFGLGLGGLLATFSQSTETLGISLGVLGFFAAIYHPVGIAMLTKRPGKIGLRVGVNGVWGNMGVAAAPVFTGILIAYADWRLGFLLPSIFCICFGLFQLFAFVENEEVNIKNIKNKAASTLSSPFSEGWKIVLFALSITTLSGGFIFGALTFLIPRLFEVSMVQISTDVAITGLLAGLVYAIASFSQIGTGWLVDKVPPKYVLSAMGLGQLIFIYIASQSSDYNLLFIMLAAMIFVFGQVPITDVILVKYVQDSWRGRVLSIKFMVNLSAGASVLPITSLLLKNGYNFSFVLQCLSVISIAVIISGLLLPNKEKKLVPIK